MDTNKLKELAEPCSMCGGKGYYCEFSTLETCWCVEPATKADEASELRAEVDKLKRLIAERWKPEVERLRKDAERYRWIKSESNLTDYVDSYALPVVNAWDFRPGPQPNTQYPSLDEAIDAAIDAALEGGGR